MENNQEGENLTEEQKRALAREYLRRERSRSRKLEMQEANSENKLGLAAERFRITFLNKEERRYVEEERAKMHQEERNFVKMGLVDHTTKLKIRLDKIKNEYERLETVKAHLDPTSLNINSVNPENVTFLKDVQKLVEYTSVTKEDLEADLLVFRDQLDNKFLKDAELESLFAVFVNDELVLNDLINKVNTLVKSEVKVENLEPPSIYHISRGRKSVSRSSSTPNLNPRPVMNTRGPPVPYGGSNFNANNIHFKQKYLKYKQKYLELKSRI